MGSTYKKIKYNDTGNYGSTEEKYLYIQHNRGCDVTTYFDDNGEYILSYDDTLKGNIVDKICESHNDWEGENMEQSFEYELKEVQEKHEKTLTYSLHFAKEYYSKLSESDKKKFLEDINK